MNAFGQITLTDEQLMNMVNRIAIEPGRNEKERFLADLTTTTQGRELINLCYNPFLTWGVTCKKMPDLSTAALPHATSQFSNIKGLLAQLAARSLSGNAAREAVSAMFQAVNPSAQRLLWLCLNKDLKAGINTSSIKAVDPALVPTFAVMRAHPYEEKRITEFPVAVEPKYDGFRVTFVAKDGGGAFLTRTGKVIEDLDHMVEPTLKALRHWASFPRLTNGDYSPINDLILRATYVQGTPQIVLDGEMMPDSNQFNDVKRAMKEGRVIFRIFDMLTWEDFDAMGAVEVPYADRRLCVLDLIAQAKHLGDRLAASEMEPAFSHDDIQRIYANHRAAGQEGAMVKRLDSFYEKKKSHAWLKLKNEDTEDLPVIGVFQGQAGGKYENTIGGLIVDRNGVEVRVSGIDDATRAAIWNLWLQDAALIPTDPNVGYKGESFDLTRKSWENRGDMLLLGKIIEVEYHEVTPDGSLRHPRFIQFREDKDGEIEK